MLNRNNFLFLFKLVIFSTLLYYIYISVPWKGVGETLLSASLDLLILSIFIQFISYIFLALRWGLIVKKTELNLSFYEIIKISLIGVAFNNILPSSIGGDFVRGAYIVKKGMSLSNAILTLIIDRVLALFSLLVITCVFLIVYSDRVTFSSEIIKITMFMILTIFILVLILKTRFSKNIIQGFLLRYFSKKNTKIILMLNNLYNYSINKDLFFKVFLMTFITMLVEILVFWLASKSLGMNYSLHIFVLAVPLITIASALPISLGGLLMREASGIFLLTLLGINILHASSIVIIFIPIILISSFPGLYFYLKKHDFS